MAGLLYKDITVNRKTFFSFLLMLLFVGFSLISGFDDFFEDLGLTAEIKVTICIAFLSMYVFVLCSTATEGLIKNDEKRMWAYYMTSAPNGIIRQIGSKYIFLLMVLGVCVVLLAAVEYMLCVRADVKYAFMKNMGTYSSVIALQLIYSSIELPCMIRFGVKAGMSLKSGIVVLLMFAAIVYFLFGDLTVFQGENPWYIQLISSVNDGKFTVWDLTPVFAAVVYFLSCLLSCRLYLKGTDSYEK